MGLSPKEQKKTIYESRTVLLIWAVLCYSASIADKEKTVLCHFLSAPRLMKKVAERIFIAPPKL